MRDSAQCSRCARKAIPAEFSSPKALKGVAWAVDGIGALSHHMARLILRGLKIPEDQIRWEAVGPPPQRIAALLEGRVGASLIRTEEALALDRDHGDKVRRRLDFDELKRLVPLQPHGVLASTEAYERAHPQVLAALAKAMIQASRALHDDSQVFADVIRAQVCVPLSEDELRLLWKREHASGGWAVNGEMNAAHWQGQLALFHELNPQLRKFDRREILAASFVAAALAELGLHPADFDKGVSA